MRLWQGVHIIGVVSLLVLATGCGPAVTRKPAGESSVPTRPSMHTLARSELCVTEGEVASAGGSRMEVRSGAMRAVAAEPTAPIAELRFVYQGPSRETVPLRNGEVRRQIGLKLRARDSCNVVYVMWRIERENRLAVSIKHNPEKHSHNECGDAGYRSIEPRESRPLPVLVPGQAHSLSAEMRGDELRAFVDGSLAWDGDLGSEAQNFDGPVGVRTDNGEFVFELAAGPSAGGTGGTCGPIAQRGSPE